jgi:hypothetical protein
MAFSGFKPRRTESQAAAADADTMEFIAIDDDIQQSEPGLPLLLYTAQEGARAVGDAEFHIARRERPAFVQRLHQRRRRAGQMTAFRRQDRIFEGRRRTPQRQQGRRRRDHDRAGRILDERIHHDVARLDIGEILELEIEDEGDADGD